MLTLLGPSNGPYLILLTSHFPFTLAPLHLQTLVGDSENLIGNLKTLISSYLLRRVYSFNQLDFFSFNFSISRIRLKMDGAGGSSGGAAAAAGAGVVPASAIEAVNQTLAYLKELKPQLEQLFSLASDPEVLAALEPLQQAKTMLLLAEATTTLYTLQLRCTGVDPENHRVKSEIERINVYREKFQKCLDQSKEPLRPTTVLNRQAATRFIEHSLPDLTSTQKQNIRDLSKGEKSRIRNSETTARKRKYQSNEKQSVQSAAKDFLEKAAREIIGNNENGLKGPLMAAGDGSDDVEVGTA